MIGYMTPMQQERVIRFAQECGVTSLREFCQLVRGKTYGDALMALLAIAYGPEAA